MGASHTTTVTSPVVLSRTAQSNQATAHYSSTYRHETDAPDTLVPPSRLRGARRKYLLSLDRNMKSFLRASNLPGLEYRLKLAGYHMFDDLLCTDRETLEARGFTGIMAQRLMNAVSEYVSRQVHRSDEERLPFRLVRRGQRLQTEPSESMKDNPNYRKQNVKRQKYADDPAKRTLNVLQRDMPPATKLTSPTPPHVQLRLMSEDDLQLQHLLSPPREVSRALTGDSDRDSNGTELPPEDGGRRVLGVIVEDVHVPSIEEPQLLEEPPFLDLDVPLGESLSLEELSTDSEDMEETDFSTDLAFGPQISRSFSVPADFKLTLEETATNSKDRVVTCIRTLSCPPSLALLSTQPHMSIGTLIDALGNTHVVSELYRTLRTLLQQTKYPCNAVEATKNGALVAVVNVLEKHCEVLKVAKVCCQLIQHMCRAVVRKVETAHTEAEPECCSTSESAIPRDSLSAVCKALDSHPTARVFLTRALVTAASLCAADVSQCHAMLCEDLLDSVAKTMEALQDDAGIQAVGIATLATALAHVPEGWLPLLLEHGHVLDLVLQAMTCHPGDSRLQHYSVSFLALLVSVVANQIDAGVMQLIVERTAVTLETMSNDSHVICWGCNVFAHAASNAALKEWKLAARCCDPLMDAMRTFPQDSATFSWAAYALCQLASSHRVCDHLIASDLTALLDRPSPKLIPLSKTDTYLQHLRHLLAKTVTNL